MKLRRKPDLRPAAEKTRDRRSSKQWPDSVCDMACAFEARVKRSLTNSCLPSVDVRDADRERSAKRTREHAKLEKQFVDELLKAAVDAIEPQNADPEKIFLDETKITLERINTLPDEEVFGISPDKLEELVEELKKLVKIRHHPGISGIAGRTEKEYKDLSTSEGSSEPLLRETAYGQILRMEELFGHSLSLQVRREFTDNLVEAPNVIEFKHRGSRTHNEAVRAWHKTQIETIANAFKIDPTDARLKDRLAASKNTLFAVKDDVRD